MRSSRGSRMPRTARLLLVCLALSAAVAALAADTAKEEAQPPSAPAAQPAATPAEPPAAPPTPAPLGPPTYTKDGADTCRRCHDEEDAKVQVLFKTKHAVKA